MNIVCPRFTAQEEAALAESKSIENQHQLVLSCVPWLIRRCEQFVTPGIDFDDLLGAGFIALVRAAKKFDPKLKWRFITLATLYIDQALQKEIRQYGQAISLPVVGNNYSAAAIACMNKIHGKVLKFDSRKDTTHITQNDLVVTLCADKEEKENQMAFLKEATKILTRRERWILLQRLNAIPLRVIGEEIGVTKERIRQIEKKAIDKIKDFVATTDVGELPRNNLPTSILELFSNVAEYNQAIA